MPLKKEFTHRLIKTFQIVLPVVVVALLVSVAWNYWTKVRFKPRLPNLSKLPKELSLRTENFNFSKTQGERTIFTIHADTNLGFSDDKNRLEGVDVIIYGDNPSDPPRKLKSKNCTYNQKTDDMECSGNVELRLDTNTTVRTENAVYNHVNKTVTANTPSQIIRTDTMTGEANRLEYSMDSGLLKLAGSVKLHSSKGVDLESGFAVFQEKENWATASDSVLMKSKNGWIRGRQARAELTPITYQPRTVVVEGDVSSESTSPDTGAIWDLRSNWVQATLSPNGAVEHVLARNNVELTKKAPDGTMVMVGNEIETQINDAGRMEVVQARQDARMKFADDRTLTGETIWANADESISTTGPSVLQVGDAHVTGNTFSIQNGDIVTFHTDKRATLTQQDRVTTADITDAKFQNSQLLSLVQTGHFTIKQADQTGSANKATMENGGDILTLEGSAKVIDPKMQVEANRIQINDRTKTKTASKNVKTVSTESGERVLVTADTVTATEDDATYTGSSRDRVHLYRGAGFIEAEKVEGPIGSKVFRATATGNVFSTMNNLRTWADRLDYDDGTHIAHYVGSVTALKQDMKITAADMIVKLNDDAPRASSEFTESSVQEITARGRVLVTRKTSRGSGDQAVYDADSQQMVLTGAHPEVTDGQGTTTQGPRITVNVSGDRMNVVEGAGNERAVTTHRVKP